VGQVYSDKKIMVVLRVNFYAIQFDTDIDADDATDTPNIANLYPYRINSLHRHVNWALKHLKSYYVKNLTTFRTQVLMSIAVWNCLNKIYNSDLLGCELFLSSFALVNVSPEKLV